MKVLLESYGCTLNKGEAAELGEALESDGQIVVSDASEDFDRAVVFTCCVIETTQRKMLKRIGELAAAGKEITVCGCLGAVAESEILKLAPEARIFPPTEHSAAAADLCGQVKIPAPALSDAVGILPIASGCTGRCTYCITRLARGQLVSRSPGVIIERARTLASAGAAEIQVTAQDTGVYGSDIGTDLPSLLEKLASVKGDHMLRVGMMTPNPAPEALKRLVESFSSPRIFKFLHLPLQSGSDRILADMGRRYTVSDFLAVVQTCRGAFPEMTLSTDVIVGFPGETDEDFHRTLAIIREVAPDIINVTRFSPRPGTPAAEMPDQVPGWEAKERSREMTELRFAIGSEKNRALVGRTFDALAVECRKPGTTFFRTPEYKPVIVDGDLPLGEWKTLEVTDAEPTHLFGRPV